MDAAVLETDYLVIGAGANAMSFVDTLLDETGADIVMVDRHHRPGGHWNDAYPFVRLHSPSAFYGVNSRELGRGGKDLVGLNQGLSELASGAEVVDYFDRLMNQRFLSSGRVRYFPMCEVDAGGGRSGFSSLLTGARQAVTVRRKIVDATHARTEVPSTRPPPYPVAPGVRCVPPNELPKIGRPHPAYVVVGSGKTGIDTCQWLLQSGVAPGAIRWIVPRDAWFLDRAAVQPGMDSFDPTFLGLARQMEAVADATSISDLFLRLEAANQVLRLSPAIEPTMYRCATVAAAEMREVRRIEHIVRLGHVRSIEPTRIVLERGAVPAAPDWLYIDCTANGIPAPRVTRVFDGDTVNLLIVRTCLPAFSSALIGFVESLDIDDTEKNALCASIPPPSVPADWLRMLAIGLANGQRWARHPAVSEWLGRARLNTLGNMVRGIDESDANRQALLRRYRTATKQAAARLPELLMT
ncbi:FAD/NAD(P)-binding protein [Variovorax sp. dw_308]|uniref:FAD/NAD(P)-binding protein n=1 Tax=Variovorax sp. dw_308 TaxID=2721546 RepID=UPI001C43B246|nr:FAD/NAD(P)-binding protein [Variovorax sp. dw_308]